MELERLSKKLSSLSTKVEKSYIKDIKTVIDTMMGDFEIYYKDTDQLVSNENIINRFRAIFSTQDNIIICKGISQNGNKCTRKTTNESDFCKVHGYLAFKQHQESKSQNLYIIEEQFKQNDNQNLLDKTNLELIDDTFYYVDSHFIYDKDSFDKVGYVEYNNSKTEYILTDDPFILGM
jgi:hypothetical protein